MTMTRTIDPYSRLGTAYVLLFSGFQTASVTTRRNVILFLYNVAASIGRPFEERDEAALPDRILHDEFVTIIETLADSPVELHPMLQDDFEEGLAIYLPAEAVKHVAAHQLWKNDPENWARMMGFVLTHLSVNSDAARSITHVIGEYATSGS